MDAWRSGGLYEGQPATDEAVLAYWRKRSEGLSDKDPEKNALDNTIMQFEYAVAESKNSTLYAQGKITAQERGQFFLDWAKKVPVDTEFYRTLQRNAAQFVETVKSTARASASGARAQASASADVVTSNNYEWVGDTATKMLTQFARDNGFIGQNEDLDKISFSTNDGAGRMIDLIAAMNTAHPEWVAALRKGDPSLTTLTYDYYQQALDRQLQGLRLRYNRAVAEGRMGTSNGQPGATALKTQMDDLVKSSSQAGMWDTAQTYLAMRDNFLAVWEDSGSSPVEKVKAWKAYRDGLIGENGQGGLANDPANPVDPVIATALVGEATLNPSIDSWYENYTRDTSVGASATSGDNAETRMDVERFLMEYAAVSDGTGQTVWTYGERDSKGVFTPKAGGTTLGATSIVKAIQAGAKSIPVSQNDGTSLTVYVAPVKVTAVAKGADGNPLPAVLDASGTEASSQVGTALDVWTHGQLVRVYGYVAGDGSMRYTTVPPWGGGVNEYQNPDGSITVDVTGAVVAGKGTINTITGKTGFNPAAAAKDQIRATAGINEKTDFISPKMAALAATPDGKEQLGNLASNAQLRSEIEQDALTFMLTPDGRIDVAKWRVLTDQLDRWSTVAPTKAEYYNDEGNTPAFGDEPAATVAPAPTLLDQVKSAFNPFAALATTMSQPGRLAPPPPPAPQGPQIRMPMQLTVPSAPFVAPPTPQGVSPWTLPPPPPPMAPYVAPPLPQGVTTQRPFPKQEYGEPDPWAIPPPPPPPPSSTPSGYQPTFEELAAGWTPS